jgi:hypothetical protein
MPAVSPITSRRTPLGYWKNNQIKAVALILADLNPAYMYLVAVRL